MKMYSEHRLSISKNTEPTCLKLHDSFIWETQLNKFKPYFSNLICIYTIVFIL